MAGFFHGTSGRCRYAYGVGICRGVYQSQPHYGVRGLPGRAAESLLRLLQVFFVAGAALVPRQSFTVLAGEVLVISGVSWLIQTIAQIRYARSRVGRSMVVAAQPNGDEPDFDGAILSCRDFAGAAESWRTLSAGAGDCFFLHRGSNECVGATGGDSPVARLLAFAGAFDVVAEEQGEASFADRASGEFKDGLRGFGFGGGEVEAVYFEKQNSDHKAGALISVNEGMVLDDACGVCGRHVDYVG